MKEIVLPEQEYETRIDTDGVQRTHATLRHFVLHAVGLDNDARRRMKRVNGEKVYFAYRNYFNTWLGEAPWPELEEAGLAAHRFVRKHEDGRSTTDYYLTAAGLDWLSKNLGFRIVEKL